MKASFKYISYLISIVFTIVIIAFALSKSDIDNSWTLIRNANYWFLVPVLMASVFGNIVRALRWKSLFPHRNSVRFWSLFLSIMSAYCVNYGVPRFGEITRCWILQKRENIKFAEIAGTVVAERVVDVISLFAVVIFTIIAQREKFNLVFDRYLAVSLDNVINSLADNHLLIYLIIGFVVILVILLFKYWNDILRKLGARVSLFVASFMVGLKGILFLKNRFLFLIYTVLIWFSYFATSYFVFYGVSGAENLSIAAGVAVLAFGSIARTVPAFAGSAGLYHLVVVFTLGLFGLAQSPREAIAILIHGVQMIFFITVGGSCLLFVMVKK